MTETTETALYVTDEELIRRIGVPDKIARDAIRMLDADPRSGFPRKQKLWGDRRYWPAIRTFFDKTNGVRITDDAARLATENRDRTRLPRLPHTEPVRRAFNNDR